MERDLRAVDMSQDGQLNDWFKSMSTVNARTRCLAGDLAYRGEQMQTRLNALAAAMKYLADGGRLTRDGAGDPMPGLGPGKDIVDGTRATVEADELLEGPPELCVTLYPYQQARATARRRAGMPREIRSRRGRTRDAPPLRVAGGSGD